MKTYWSVESSYATKRNPRRIEAARAVTERKITSFCTFRRHARRIVSFDGYALCQVARRKNFVGVLPCPLTKRECGCDCWLSAINISSSSTFFKTT